MLRRHTRLAQPVDFGDGDAAFPWPGVSHDLGTISIGAGVGQAIRAGISGLPHAWTGGYDAEIGFSVTSLLLALTPFFTLRALREQARICGVKEEA